MTESFGLHLQNTWWRKLTDTWFRANTAILFALSDHGRSYLFNLTHVSVYQLVSQEMSVHILYTDTLSLTLSFYIYINVDNNMMVRDLCTRNREIWNWILDYARLTRSVVCIQYTVTSVTLTAILHETWLGTEGLKFCERIIVIDGILSGLIFFTIFLSRKSLMIWNEFYLISII